MATNNFVETRWCIEHERYCSVFLTDLNIPYHLEARMEDTISGEPYVGYDTCFGPFTALPQPEPLNESQWNVILSTGEQKEVLEWQ